MCPSNTPLDMLTDIIGGAIGGAIASIPGFKRWESALMSGFSAAHATTVSRAVWKPLNNKKLNVPAQVLSYALGTSSAVLATFLPIHPIASGLVATGASGSLGCALQHSGVLGSPGNILGESVLYGL